jgi:hypothetical protein
MRCGTCGKRFKPRESIRFDPILKELGKPHVFHCSRDCAPEVVPAIDARPFRNPAR